MTIKTRADCIKAALALASKDAGLPDFALYTDRIQALCALATLLPEDPPADVTSSDAIDDLPDPRLGEVVETVWGPARWTSIGDGFVWRLVADGHALISGSVGMAGATESHWWAWDGPTHGVPLLGRDEASSLPEAITAVLDCLRTAGKLR